MKRTRHGLTRTDILTGICCATLVAAIGSVVLGADGNGARTQAQVQKDSKQLREVHQAIVVSSREHDGRYIRPGQVNRLPFEGREIPGRGAEDTTANTTANLYSVLIVQNYIGTKVSISPVDRNPNVKEKRDYGWDKYDPPKDSYWDDSLAADLTKESNTSYAHLVIYGKRADQNWRNSLDAGYAVLGNRGPLEGESDYSSYTCGPYGQWTGSIAFADNHTEVISTFRPVSHKPRTVDGKFVKDNIFAMEDGPDGGDAILSFTMAITDDGPKLQHD